MKHRHGFTIIELSLSIAFISTLLLLLSFLIIQMTSIYQKTLSVKAVNATGRELIDQFSRNLSAATLISTSTKCSLIADGYKDACTRDNAFKLIYHQYESENFEVSGQDLVDPVPTSGIFCTGLYTYIWNTGYVLNSRNRGASTYRARVRYSVDGNNVERDDFRLLRVFNPLGNLCNANINGSAYTYRTDPANITYDLPAGEEPEELISTAEAELALYDLRIFHPARHIYSGQAYYSGTFILGTLQGQIDIQANGDYCKAPPADSLGEFAYCAINKFNFASQATGVTDD
ncbi:hypothetical protein IJG78_00225 [Candidatus Saccharibacteria bacterium]|nr:hypothetical protein [Candidatus Saccharibacteria bacterium]